MEKDGGYGIAGRILGHRLGRKTLYTRDVEGCGLRGDVGRGLIHGGYYPTPDNLEASRSSGHRHHPLCDRQSLVSFHKVREEAAKEHVLC